MALVKVEPAAESAEAESTADQGSDAADKEPSDADAGVGVLGWLGFVIINMAAWGIIAVSSALAWPLGLFIALVYTGILMGLAVFIQRWGRRYRSFENLLWVLACWFVFILGLYLSVNVVGPAFDEDVQSSPPVNDFTNYDPIKLLPVGSSPSLLAWADESSSLDRRDRELPTYAEFQGYVFFRGMSSSFRAKTSSSAILLRSDASSTFAVTPVLTNPRSFVHFQSQLLFLAWSEGQGDGLWSISQSGAAQADAALVKSISGPNSFRGSLSDLIVDGGSLYFRAEYDCDGTWYRTIYSLNDTSAEPVNLRGNDCKVQSIDSSSTGEIDTSDEKPTAVLWGTLLIGIGPMLLVASAIVVYRRLPGLFMNLFLGVGIAVILLYLIGLDEDSIDSDGVFTFLKWFITLYTAAAYVSITLVSVLMTKVPELIEDMKPWIVAIAGLPFFIVIHFDLEVPVTQEAWAWLLYSFLAVVQMLISIAVSETFPMVLGALSTFVISWKIAREIVRTIFGPDLGEVETLTLLGIMALQGVGIMAGAILYAGRRAEVDAFVRGALLRCLKQEARVEASS